MLDVAEQMEQSFHEDASSDGIHFDRPRGVEWLNDVFQRHISALEADLLETAEFTFGPPPNPPFLASRDMSSRLGAMVDSRDSSRTAVLDYRVPRRWRPRKCRHKRPKIR